MTPRILAPGLLLASLAATPFAHADTVAGAYAGAAAWGASADGSFAGQGAATDFGFDRDTTGMVWLALEHPVPLLPNLKVAWTGLETEGDTVVTGQFEFEGAVYTANTAVTGSVDMDLADATLYWEVLDLDTLSIDLGVTLRWADGSLTAESADARGQADFSGVLPMAYGRVSGDLPFTGWGVAAEGQFLSYDGHSLRDLRAAITWNLLETLAVDADVLVGVRSLRLELDDLDDISTDLEFDGVFVGLELDF